MSNPFFQLSSGYWRKMESVRAYSTLLVPDIWQKDIEVYTRMFEFFLSAAPEGEVDPQMVGYIGPLRQMASDSATLMADEDELQKGTVPLVAIAGFGMNQPQMLDLFQRMQHVQLSHELIRQSVLITLTSSFELLLSNLLHRFYKRYPGALPPSDKGMSIHQLIKFDSISEAVESVVTQRVDALMRATPDNWKTIFIRTYDVDMNNLIGGRWQALVEVFQRRNLLVHNDGIVDEQYYRHIQKRASPSITIGDRLDVTSDYLEDALMLFTHLGCTLIDSCWTRERPQEHELREESLLKIVLDCLLTGRWTIAERLCRYALSRESTSQDSELVYKVNLWLAQKRLGQWDQVKDEVEAADTGTLSPINALAIHSLCEDHESFFRALPVALESGFSEQDLRSWPVFQEMRGLPEFENHLSEILLRQSQ